MSSPRQHAPPRAWERRGLAAPRRGAAHRVRVPSDTRYARDNIARVHAALRKAVEGLRGVGRAAERTCTSRELQQQRSLSRQAKTLPWRSACLLRAGDAQVSRRAFRVTPALYAGER